jgi:hypothetical protein
MTHDFLTSIREQAVFAWGLTGINGSLADHARGKPSGEAAPPAGFEVWASNANQATPGSTEPSPDQERRTAAQMFGDPGLGRH